LSSRVFALSSILGYTYRLIELAGGAELAAEQSSTQIVHPDSGAEEPRLRILLAEDSPTSRLIVTANLEQAGCVVRVVDNGRKAVQALEEGDFDLVLMDVFMPEMDGLDAARAIRRREKGSGRRVPIIAMTGTDTQEHRGKCLEAGMDGFVSKPVTPNEFREVIASLLPRDQDPRDQDPRGREP
jgi:two-component system sensor histidine kinase/response regulator